MLFIQSTCVFKIIICCRLYFNDVIPIRETPLTSNTFKSSRLIRQRVSINFKIKVKPSKISV